jgi:NADH-quinone oxidoreductase subunit C
MSENALAEAVPGSVLASSVHRGQTSLEIAPAQLVEVCLFLRDQQRFNRLSGVTAVDWYPTEPRFEIVYLVHSIECNERLRLKCRLPSCHAEIESVTGVWPGANWYEREVFDLFGVVFLNHPDLRRIMMPETWEGHPLRKDYPVTGLKYDYTQE